MRTMKMMANYAKGIMLAAFMTVGTSAVNAQEESGSTEGAETKTYAPAAASEYWRGENVENTTEAYIFNVGAKTFITGKNASTTDIEAALTWHINGNSPYTFACSNEDRIAMKTTAGFWFAEIKEKSGATDFTLVSGTTEDKGYCYKLSAVGSTYIRPFKYENQTRYFSVSGNSYDAKQEQDIYNDWLFISAVQKEAYTEYATLYKEAVSLLADESLEGQDELKQALESALDNTTASNYDKYGDDIATLKNAITPAKQYIDNITSGIHCIKPATTDNAKVAAIYSINGVRNAQLTKGINIIKMNDGSVKKILVK